jgi:hypothetical protein
MGDFFLVFKNQTVHEEKPKTLECHAKFESQIIWHLVVVDINTVTDPYINNDGALTVYVT